MQEGGALVLYQSSSAVLSGCSFDGCVATASGVNSFAVGGALLIVDGGNTTLSTLVLSATQPGELGGVAIAAILFDNSSLTRLDMSGQANGCGIGSIGARKLAAALRRNAALTNLNVEGNGIGDAGVRAIAKALREENRTMKALGIEHETLRGTLNRCRRHRSTAGCRRRRGRPTLAANVHHARRRARARAVARCRARDGSSSEGHRSWLPNMILLRS